MTLFPSKIAFILAPVCCFTLSTIAVHGQRQTTGYPDLDLYYSQIDHNIFQELNTRRNHLLDSMDLHISLGECYLEKGDLAAVKSQIEMARNFIQGFTENDKQNRLKALYVLESKYYSHLGQYDKSDAFLDSAIISSLRLEELTRQHIILLGEQELQEAEMQLKNQQIAQHKRTIILASIILILIIAALLRLMYLYRKNRIAYRSLAAEAMQWAERSGAVPAAEKETNGDHLPDEEDKALANKSHQLMLESKPYKGYHFTIDSLAKMLGVNRNKLSRAINRTAGQNFNQYINEYRIREAILLMSEENANRLSMEQIMEEAGFDGRSSFYNAFKKITGLTPAQYRKNKKYGFPPSDPS